MDRLWMLELPECGVYAVTDSSGKDSAEGRPACNVITSGTLLKAFTRSAKWSSSKEMVDVQVCACVCASAACNNASCCLLLAEFKLFLLL